MAQPEKSASIYDRAGEIPPQLPLEGAMDLASKDERSPLKNTFIGHIADDLADTAKLAFSPFRRSAVGTRDKIQNDSPNWVLDNSARFVAGAHVLGELSYMITGQTLPSPIKIEGFGKHGYGGIYENPFDGKGWRKGLSDLAKNFSPSASLEKISQMPILEQKSAATAAYGKWRTYSALTGLTMFGLSALFNPPPDNAEEQARMAKKYDEDKVGYFTERLGQMFRPDKHARESIGLGMLAVGVFSGICGLKQRQFHRAGIDGVSGGYMKEVYAAALSIATGAAMIGSVEDAKAWQRFGQIMPIRLIFTLPRSVEIWKANRDPYYAGGVGMFQLMNFFSYTLGGTSSQLNNRHSMYSRLAEKHEALDQRWRREPLYTHYHEQAEEMLERVKRRNGASANDRHTIDVPVQHDVEHRQPPSEALSHKDAPPASQVHEVQEHAPVKDAASREVA